MWEKIKANPKLKAAIVTLASSATVAALTALGVTVSPEFASALQPIFAGFIGAF